MKTALIAGSTGLIGQQLLQLLIKSPLYEKVTAITRQDLPTHPKLVQIKIEFGSITENSGMLKADDVFCCLGTTMAKAGSKEKFRQVDFYYPYLLAKTTYAIGAKQYLIVSALGANKSSSIFCLVWDLMPFIFSDRHCCLVTGLKNVPVKIQPSCFTRSSDFLSPKSTMPSHR
jgi:hypothetical protein